MSLTRPLLRAPLVFFIILAIATSVCAGSQQTPDTHPAAQQTAPRLQSTQLLTAHADWMPADTIAVMIGEPHVLRDIARDAFPTAERGGDVHFDNLQRDVSQMFQHHIGLDLRQTDAVILALGAGWQTLILTGELDPAALDKQQAFQVHGHTIYQFQPGILRAAQNPIWGIPLKNQQGIALFLTSESAEQAVIAHTTNNTLANAPANFEVFHNLLEATPSENLVLAAHFTDAFQNALAMLTTIPIPQTLRLDYGDQALRARIQASPQVLDHYENILDSFRIDMPARIRSIYNTDHLTSAMERVGFLFGYHLAMSYADALQVERTPETLAANTALPRNNFLMLLSVGAATAIPAYQQYIDRAKALQHP